MTNSIYSPGGGLADAWKTLATLEANTQNADPRIVLATVEAETGGTNTPGDMRANGYNALGYGQVWPSQWPDAFVYAANRYHVAWPSDLPSQTQLVLNNDGLSMAAAVYVIKHVWDTSNQDFRQFSLHYVGPAIPDSDYQRRYNIWLKYANATDLLSASTGSTTGSSTFSGEVLPTAQYGIIPYSQTLGNVLYGRRYRILISNSLGVAMDVSQLRCVFSVNKTVLQQPNFSSVAIHNLSPTTESTLITEGNRFIIEAGYEGEQYGVIFDGQLIQPIRDKEDGVTYRLTLYGLDGDQYLNRNLVNFTVTRGQTSRNIADKLLSQATVPAQLGSISDGLDQVQLSRGKVFFGNAKDYFRQLAHTHNAAFYIEDGKVNLIKMSDYPTGEILDLSPTTGLIGTPAQNENGVTIKILLNPHIRPGSLVHIDNSLIQAQRISLNQFQRTLDNDGIYRIISVTHMGDTRGENWYTECVGVSQSGAIPAIIRDALSNPF